MTALCARHVVAATILLDLDCAHRTLLCHILNLPFLIHDFLHDAFVAFQDIACHGPVRISTALKAEQSKTRGARHRVVFRHICCQPGDYRTVRPWAKGILWASKDKAFDCRVVPFIQDFGSQSFDVLSRQTLIAPLLRARQG